MRVIGYLSGPRLNSSLQWLLYLLLAMALSACGGDGNHSRHNQPARSDNTSGHDGWVKNRFVAAANFANRCAAPRTGIAPYNNQPYSDTQGSYLDENNWLRAMSHSKYLWYREIVDKNPANYPDTHKYFDTLKTTQLTATGSRKDKFHWHVPTAEYRAATESGVSTGYGGHFMVLHNTVPREVVVAFTDAQSPAAQAHLTRGTRILKVDGVDLVNDNSESGINTLNAGLYPDTNNQTHHFVVQDLHTSGTRQITMTSAHLHQASVPTTKVISTATGNVGYILFTQHNAPAEAELISAIEHFSAQGVSDVVLDLRYNGGGYLYIASELAFMLAGESRTAGKIFEQLSYNDQHQPENPTPFYNTDTQSQPLPSLDLNRVFVLTGGNTCSASESVINSLRGIDVKVIQIGGRTCGKPYGAIIQENCGTSYFTIMFKGANNKGYGDYGDGFFPGSANSSNRAELPGCAVSDDLEHLLGNVHEARLSAALAYRNTGSCPAQPPVQTRGKQKIHLPALNDGTIIQPPGMGDKILGGRHALR